MPHVQTPNDTKMIRKCRNKQLQCIVIDILWKVFLRNKYFLDATNLINPYIQHGLITRWSARVDSWWWRGPSRPCQLPVVFENTSGEAGSRECARYIVSHDSFCTIYIIRVSQNKQLPINSVHMTTASTHPLSPRSVFCSFYRQPCSNGKE